MLKFFVADPDPGSDAFMPWIRGGKIRIWDKHPGSAPHKYEKMQNSSLGLLKGFQAQKLTTVQDITDQRRNVCGIDEGK
jgi:hypothetical protein